MRNLAIIPARSGSKGLKDKNIKDLKGKPLMAYSIEAAAGSGIFDEIHVSTDSEQYAEIARRHGADVPFLRSAESSSDMASSWDVVKEVLGRYRDMGKTFDVVTLLQPTSPLRTAEDILNAAALFRDKNAKAVVAVCEMEHSPLWCNTLPADLSMDGFVNRKAAGRRQDLKTYYRINGAIYMVCTDYLFEDDNIYREGSYAYIMDRRKSIDIDTLYDFRLAAFLMGGGGYWLSRKFAQLQGIRRIERRCA